MTKRMKVTYFCSSMLLDLSLYCFSLASASFALDIEINQSINQSIYLPICLSIDPIHLFPHPSVCLSVHQSVCLSLHPSVSLSVPPSVLPSISQSVSQSVRPSVSQPVRPSICLSVRPSVSQLLLVGCHL